MPRQARAEQTRDAIVAGAAEVFDRYGYASANLSDIVAQAGVTKGALYFHFRSKEEIAQAVVEQQHEMSVVPARELLKRDDAAGLESVIRLSQRLADQLRREIIVRGGIRLTLETGTFQLPMPTPYQEWIEIIEQLLRRSVDTQDLDSTVSPRKVAEFLAPAFTGVQLVSQVLTGREDLQAQVQNMWELLLPALVPARKLAYFRSLATAPSSESRNNHPVAM